MNTPQMICYTRNFEDVILQRVFSDVTQGCYVDVGASTPIVDSNTYALYTKGWRGICVDPMQYVNWPGIRPDDIFVNAALGAAPGETEFYIYESSPQISTASPEIKTHWSIRGGMDPRHSVKVPVRTLNDVLAEHLADRVLHLMSIDVEGMEKEVLEGLDLQRYRPWLMVLEAVTPGTPEPNHESWEPILLANDYHLVYFDGVNRFYLAQEHLDLEDRFSLPPNVWDNFVSFQQQQLEQRIQELEKNQR